MKNLPTYTLVLLLLGGPSKAVAQFGTYTGAGLGVDGSAAAGDAASTVGVTAGYVFSSPFEVGGRLSRREFEDMGLTATRFGPYMAVYPVRENQGYPFSVVMEGRYQRVRYSGDRTNEFDEAGVNDTGDRFRIEIGGFPSLQVSDALRLLPYLGVSYALRTEAGAFQSREELTGLHFRLPFQYRVGNAVSIVLAPIAFVGDDDNTRYGGTAALVFSPGTDR